MPRPNRANAATIESRAHSGLHAMRPLTPAEWAWSEVLHDASWHCPDPVKCCMCEGKPVYKVIGQGFCHNHHSQAVQAAQISANALLGRYDRLSKSSRLTFGNALISQSLSKSDIAEVLS